MAAIRLERAAADAQRLELGLVEQVRPLILKDNAAKLLKLK